jgi:hypothetical protein
LNSGAGVFQSRGGGGVGDPEGWAQAEGRAVDDSDPFGFEKFASEILVVADDCP